MHFKIRHAAILVAALLAACQGMVVHVSVPDAARDKISSTDVVLPISQSEIYVFVPASTAGASHGLIGAIVDSVVDQVRSSKAEAAAKPLRAVVSDYNFDSVLKTDMQHALSQEAWLGAGAPRVMKENIQDRYNAAFTASQAAALLFVVVDYQLSNDGDELTVTALPRLYGNTPALKALLAKPDAKSPNALANALYYNTLTFKTRIPAQPSGRDGNIAVWSASHGAPLRAALNMASVKLSALLVRDLQQTPAQDAEFAKQKAENFQTIASDADGDIQRSPQGFLLYSAKNTPTGQ